MKSSVSLISEHFLIEGSMLYSTSLGNILIGCPPEILKVLMINHFPMPDTIVIPGTLHKFNSSQACLEFPFYHFLFIQQGLARGKKFRVLAKKNICKKLDEMLRVTLVGPTLEEAMNSEKKLKIPQKLNRTKIKQLVKETEFLAPKNQEGNNYSMGEMIEFIPFEKGDQTVIYDSFQDHPQVSIKRIGEDEFLVKCDKSFNCKLNISHKQTAVYEIIGTKASQAEKSSKSVFNIRCLGSSEGFDPTQPANGFLFHFNKKWLLWDCPAFLHLHLDKIGLSCKDLDAVFISHVHEDHLDIMETIDQDRKMSIYTSPEIFHCMILKLQTILECSYQKAVTYYDYHPVYANKPFELFGASCEIFYSCHVIPALGLRLTVPTGKSSSRIFLSGDTLSKRMIKQLSASKVYTPERLEEVENFVKQDENYDVLFVDSGGGIIHGDPQDYATITDKVIYMHTGKKIKDVPNNHRFLKFGQRFSIHK